MNFVLQATVLGKVKSVYLHNRFPIPVRAAHYGRRGAVPTTIPVSQSVSQSINQSINQSIKSTNQSINLVNQSINLINQSIPPQSWQIT